MTPAFLGLLVLILLAFSAAVFISVKKPRREPDPVLGLGVGAVFLSALVFALVLFVPAREGASPRGKFSLAAAACILMAWGIKKIQASRQRQKRHADQKHPDQT
jgi:NhaP-type Na+/H+ or K+/H+ antiporter